jgi:hypothetical protein
MASRHAPAAVVLVALGWILNRGGLAADLGVNKSV